MDTDVNHQRRTESVVKKDSIDRRGSSGNTNANTEIQTLQTKHKELCLELNMDSETTNLAWQTYVQAIEEHTLEVSKKNGLHYHSVNLKFNFQVHLGTK